MTRVLLTAAVLAVWLLATWGMWRGWRGRIARTALPAMPQAPELLGADLVEPLVGLYLGTTYAGAWLDRVAASSGSTPASAPKTIAASRTVRAILSTPTRTSTTTSRRRRAR